MLRNHVMDPESSTKAPAPDTPSSYPYAGSGEDWYSSQGPESPPNNYGHSNFRAVGAMPQPTINTNSSYVEYDYANELPLFEELGIRFDHIWSKTQAVILPTKVNK